MSQSETINTNSNWNTLYKTGGVAAIVMVFMIIIQSAVFIAFPPPKTVIEYFNLFQTNPLLGFLDLDLLLVLANLMLILVFLSLYAALKQINKSLITIAITFGVMGIVLLIVSREVTISMFNLSNQYFTATTESQKLMLITIGQTMLSTYNGGVFDISYVMGSIPLLIISYIMLKSNIFSKVTAILLGLSGLLMIIPPTVGTIGIIISLISLVPTMIWLILVALRLFKLSKQ
jgi:hypothetical protein